MGKRKDDQGSGQLINCNSVKIKMLSKYKTSALILLLAVVWISSITEITGTSTGIVERMRRNHNSTAAKLKDPKSSLNHNNTTGIPRNKKAGSNHTSSSPAAKRQDNSDKKKKEATKLPLETLFPTVSTKTVADYDSAKLLPTATETPEEKLKQALLNHSLHLRDMDLADKDLDHLVFSQLPEGSKLILRTVKIVRTDDDGNEADSGEETTTWDVVVSNGTSSEVGALSEEEGSSSEAPELADLLGAASHSRSQYKNDGTSLRTKEKDNKYYQEREHGKNHKVTLTDTDGKKKKKYEGGEHGVTDFANAHGNAQSNEGGRFKDSKKKNKGRKVTGFKRVYHKEEFQRTEHFYDDEEAKRIAENFSANDAKEQSAHGLKDDDRKYHGTYKEKTDGQKVKNEHQIKNGYNKGQHEGHKTNEKHTVGQKWSNEQKQTHGQPNEQYHRPKYHENHNYHGAYSNQNNKVTVPDPSSLQTGGMTSSSVIVTTPTTLLMPTSASVPLTSLNAEPGGGPRLRYNSNRLQRRPSNLAAGSSPASSSSATAASSSPSLSNPNIAMTAPSSSQQAGAKQQEMKVFFSPRERHYPFAPDDATMAYAPKFSPGQKNNLHPHHPPSNNPSPPISYSYNFRTIHPLKPLHGHGIKPRNESYGLGSPRYAGSTYGKGDPVPPAYSTLTKTLPKTLPSGNLLSIDKATGLEILSQSDPIIGSTTERLKFPSGRPQLGWVPLGPGTQKYTSAEGRPSSSSYPHFTHLRVGKTLVPTMLIRTPSTDPTVVTTNRRPPPSSQSHYVPAGQPSTLSYNTQSHGPVKRNPQFSHFMNGLMDSVAGFFGRIG